MYSEKTIAKSLRILFSGSLVLGAGLAALPAMAQEKVQRVEVTGTNIKRAEAETASPIQLISRADIDKSGKATVAEYLQSLSADGAGSLPTGFGNGFAAGSTAISLRGLGATSTLVLLNGRRMASFGRADDGQKTFTDLSTIPMELVERIEILKDGSSAVYGADAIAGVVNIILKQNYQGIVATASAGTSKYHDNNQTKAALTAGFGDYDTDRYNVMANFEVYKSNEIYNKDRAGRDWIGAGDLRPWGYPMATQFASGYISGNNSAAASPAGSIRDPKTLNYVSLPGCGTLSTTTNQDPGGGCLWYQDQFRSMQPQIEGVNIASRGTFKISEDLQAYAEFGYSSRKTGFSLTPPSITPTVAFPPNAGNASGVINYGTSILLAATHPQNPYGVPVRVRYAAFDVGAQRRNADNDFSRLVVGLKGAYAGWDFDTAILHSESKLKLTYENMLNMSVLKAALGDPTSQYFPYYIGAQANKNSAALYNALRRTAIADGKTSMDIIDFKASRELMKLPGGSMGLAVGAEYRKETYDSPALSGTEDGSINASYVAAKGDEKVYALYAEVLAPIVKSLEASAAVRYDKYTNFNSTTPKLGLKWTPMKELALRGTYSEGFRAPGAAESGSTSQSTGSATVRDPVRCPNGTPLPGATATDCSLTVAAVKVGDPSLQPEKSKGYTLGMVFDPLPNTSIALDAWKIKRSNEINPLAYAEAAALPTAIRQDNNLTINGVVVPNTGTLLISKAPYRNSSFTEVRGLDLDAKQRFALGEYGKLTADLRWTHVISWKRVEKSGVSYEYAGTHGNCDTSNCAGTPADKVNFVLGWDRGDWNVTGNVNYRGKMKNVYFEGDLCASQLANGSPAPNADCTLASFTTLDLSFRWKAMKNLEIFGSVQNVFDKVAPLDPLTYGGMSYNPMDASGAIGRYFKVGAKYTFK
ncbi:TonB-dependent receptor [Undibacterium squillarum]|uniref:TonB-dependent receptor n=1 Tax=Undibacterium squillarum TaxID=1131567 RepID=A0ABQ2Y432_9BURK|nr:TonB-dependent receptor [Undibacterium squillarum]GGX51424.1 TonB-dependent receptor [Undibacterium squillarum]